MRKLSELKGQDFVKTLLRDSALISKGKKFEITDIELVDLLA